MSYQYIETLSDEALKRHQSADFYFPFAETRSQLTERNILLPNILGFYLVHLLWMWLRDNAYCCAYFVQSKVLYKVLSRACSVYVCRATTQLCR